MNVLTEGRFSIKTKLVMTFSAILFSGIIITNIFYYRTLSSYIHNNICNTVLPLAAEEMNSEIKAVTSYFINIISRLDKDQTISSLLLSPGEGPEQISAYLQTLKLRYGINSISAISERSGLNYRENGSAVYIKSDKTISRNYLNLKGSKEQYIYELNLHPELDIPLLVFNKKIQDRRGNLLGAISMGLSVKSLINSFNSLCTNYNILVYIVDSAGIIQMHPNKKIEQYADIHKLRGISGIVDQVLNKTPEISVIKYERDDEDILLNTRYIKNLNAYLFVETNFSSRILTIRHKIILNVLSQLAGSCILIALAVLTINHFQKKLFHASLVDELTGAFNRKEFELQFRNSVYNYGRQGIQFSLIMIDIDNFKILNDTYGHSSGDSAIKHIASIARNSVRGGDILIRWGGDEFVILNSGNEENTVHVAERIRKIISETEFFPRIGGYNDVPELTVSCGVTEFRSGDTMDAILARADQALSRAKAAGRNRVIRL